MLKNDVVPVEKQLIVNAGENHFFAL